MRTTPLTMNSGQLNHDSLDAIVKKKVGQRMELCRLGDKLHLDGMDTLPVMQAKEKGHQNCSARYASGRERQRIHQRGF